MEWSKSLNVIMKNWWKAGILILLIGIAIGGYKIQCGNTKFEKVPPKLMQEKK